MTEILAFTLISLVLVMSPGPNSVLILKSVSSKGKKAGVENIFGLVTATFVHGAISILGLSALIVQSTELFFVIKLLGAAYLFYLGVKTIVATLGTKVINTDVDTNNGKVNTGNFFGNYSEGFLTQMLNPKVSMFYLAAFPQFIDFGASSYSGAFLLVAIHASIVFSGFFQCRFSLYRSSVLRIQALLVVGYNDSVEAC